MKFFVFAILFASSISFARPGNYDGCYIAVDPNDFTTSKFVFCLSKIFDKQNDSKNAKAALIKASGVSCLQSNQVFFGKSNLGGFIFTGNSEEGSFALKYKNPEQTIGDIGIGREELSHSLYREKDHFYQLSGEEHDKNWELAVEECGF